MFVNKPRKILSPGRQCFPLRATRENDNPDGGINLFLRAKTSHKKEGAEFRDYFAGPPQKGGVASPKRRVYIPTG